jgi:spore coat protein CotF
VVLHGGGENIPDSFIARQFMITISTKANRNGTAYPSNCNPNTPRLEIH